MTKRFPIGGWVAPPPETEWCRDFISPETYRAVARCGINLVYPNYEKDGSESVFRALEAASCAGVDYLVNDGRFVCSSVTPAERAGIAKRYARYPSFAGVDLRDEPTYTDLAALGKAIEANRAYLPFQFVNLLPLYAPKRALTPNGGEAAGEETEYRAYLEAFRTRCAPSVLSYDFYPFRWEFGRCDKDFFLQIALARAAAGAMGVDVWNFIQVTSWDRRAIRNLEKAEIYWQVSMSLACGIRGIHYFCLWTPVDRGGETFLPALFDRDGTETVWYDYVKDINARVAKAGSALLAATFCGLTGTSCRAPIPQKLRDGEALPFALPAGVVCGRFLCGGKSLYLLVNDSLTDPVDLRAAGVSPLVPAAGDAAVLESGAFALFEELRQTA